MIVCMQVADKSAYDFMYDIMCFSSPNQLSYDPRGEDIV